jgi:hypothetical protein
MSSDSCTYAFTGGNWADFSFRQLLVQIRNFSLLRSYQGVGIGEPLTVIEKNYGAQSWSPGLLMMLTSSAIGEVLT